MNEGDTILGSIEEDVAEELVTRRAAIRKGAVASTGLMAGLGMASVPLALAALSRTVYGQSTPTTVTAALNLALMLEIFENELYKAVLGTSASAVQNSAFAPVRATVPASAIPAIQLIQKHEAAHVAFLLANGATNVLNLGPDSFDFTGGRGSGTGPFARATVELQFLLATAQAVEDTGVRAYKGQAPNLMSDNAALEAALRIHSVEARHAAKFRRLRRQTGAPTSVRFSGTIRGGGAAAAGASNVSSPPQGVVDAFNAIYGGATPESNVTHAGVNVSTLPGLPAGVGVDAATEAFDEPLTRAEVTAIVQPFFIPNIP